MTVDESILLTIKRLLDIEEDDDSFDTDVISHINSTLADLAQLGVGPDEGYIIADDITTWRDLVGGSNLLTFVIDYVYLSVKLVFDPPQSSALIASMEKRIEKLEWRVSTAVDTVKANKT